MKTASQRTGLHAQQQPARVLHQFLDAHEEADSFAAVNQTVVVRERHVHHRPNDHLGTIETHARATALVHARPSLSPRARGCDCGAARRTCPFTATGRSLTACMPRIADCGMLMMGVPMREPKTPPFEIVNVPPARSSIASLPSRAFRAEP